MMAEVVNRFLPDIFFAGQDRLKPALAHTGCSIDKNDRTTINNSNRNSPLITDAAVSRRFCE